MFLESDMSRSIIFSYTRKTQAGAYDDLKKFAFCSKATTVLL